MTFKVGDVVRVSSDIGQYKDAQTPSRLFVSNRMINMAGQIFTIRSVTDSGKYRVDGVGDDWSWDDHILESLTPSDLLLNL